MGMSTPASVPTTPDHAPVAMTTAGASNAPAAVVTPLTRSPSRRNPRTSCCCLITTPRRFAYCWRMPPLARAVEPEHTVSRSRTITRPAPSRARWYAVLTPMMPAPTITTSAVSVMAVATIRQLRSALNDLDAAHDVGATLHRELGLDAQGLRALRLPVDLLETFPRWREG